MKAIFYSILFAIVLLCVTPLTIASVPATGTITATQTCEAFVSKNKRTNPDHIRLEIDREYSVFEANKPRSPSWFRVRVDEASPKERWVSKHCGTVDVTLCDGPGPVDEDNEANACNTLGLQDSYVLALSWQPAFCETHRSKPECRIEDKKSYQARNFTLHGLWPNKQSCGTHYGFCGEIRSRPGGFCDYPALSLFTEVRTELEQVMPSAAAGSCLQRHEWFKHGTCQADWSMDEYYEMAVDLTRQFNESGIAYFVSRNIGKRVSEADLKNRIDCALGSGMHSRIELKCRGGNLVDVYVRLPATINNGAGLGEAMQLASGQYKSNCGGHFNVDPIGLSQ